MQRIIEKFRRKGCDDIAIANQMEKYADDPIRFRDGLLSSKKIVECMSVVLYRQQIKPSVWSGGKSDPAMTNSLIQLSPLNIFKE